MSSADPRLQTSTELLRLRATEAPADAATFHRLPSGAWISTTWSAMWDEVQRAAAAFRALGLERGDRLAVLARTCREWQIAELAANLAGAAVVGIDMQSSSEQVSWILNHGQPSGLVVDGGASLAKIPITFHDRCKFILVLDPEIKTAEGKVHSWEKTVSAHGMPLPEIRSAQSTDPAILIYTSGTTGTPKGIEYSHEQLMTACWAMLDEFPDLKRSRLICWLPMAALFQRMMNLLALASHSTVYFVEEPREIMARIAEVRPNVFTSVPRFYEKVHDGIQERVAAQTGIEKRLVQAAIAAGTEVSRAVRSGARPGWALRVRHAVLDRLVLRRIRAAMGGEIRWMISGSAPTPVWLLEFFHSVGLLLLEAYGITENPVPIAANRPHDYRFGSVGKSLPTNDVRLAEDGEVLVRGSALFRGYIEEGAPPERFTPNGYYRTGDLGRFDSDGFLYLTGRISEIIKTSTGRRVSPVAIEGVYRQSRYVDQIVVIGNNRPQLTALVVLNAPAVEAALAQTNDASPTHADFRTSGVVMRLVKRDLDRLGDSLAVHEQIRGFAILSAPLSVEHGEITPTLKLRRDRIEARYHQTIEELYADGAAMRHAETER